MIMQNLPKLVNTYASVCGDHNPFTNAPGVAAYGNDAATYHNFMLSFYGDLPVMNDYNKLEQQICLLFAENAALWANMLVARQSIAANPLQEMNYTETTSRTGHDDLTKTGTETSTRTGNVADGGTDSTTDTSYITDSTVTYDNGTLRDTAKSTHGGGVSITHGKTTTYNNVADSRTFNARKDETFYSSTFTKSVSGYKTSPIEMMQKYTEFLRENNLFSAIISEIVRGISCIVYIPVTPENQEEE